MDRKQYTRTLLFQLPKEKENMKHVTLTDINPVYQLYEDGSIFSRVKGDFLSPCLCVNSYFYTLTRKNRPTSTYSQANLIRKYITGIITPQIEGVEHKPVIGYEGIYQIYTNGQVWSHIKNKWLVACATKRGYLLYCLVDSEGKTKTKYIHRLLAESFILNGPLNGSEVHHKDHNKTNNSIENLEVLTSLEHIKLHKNNHKHSPQYLAKKAERDKIKQEKLRLKKLEGRKKYTHTEQYYRKRGLK